MRLAARMAGERISLSKGQMGTDESEYHIYSCSSGGIKELTDFEGVSVILLSIRHSPLIRHILRQRNENLDISSVYGGNQCCDPVDTWPRRCPDTQILRYLDTQPWMGATSCEVLPRNNALFKSQGSTHLPYDVQTKLSFIGAWWVVSEELGIVEDGFLFRFRFLFLISFNSELAPRNREFMAQTLLLPAAEPTKGSFCGQDDRNSVSPSIYELRISH